MHGTIVKLKQALHSAPHLRKNNCGEDPHTRARERDIRSLAQPDRTPRAEAAAFRLKSSIRKATTAGVQIGSRVNADT